MAAHGARRLIPMATHLRAIIGVELLCAAQGVEHRAPLATSQPLQAALAVLRAKIEPLGEDRYLAPDLETSAGLIGDHSLVEATGIAMPALP